MDMMEKVRLINEAMEHVDSRYRLSVILFKRARAINQGDQPLATAKSQKEYFIALNEFLKGYIQWKDPSEGEWRKVK
ncbi:DNA-directed RNA polymerase subunit omega [Thermosulfidibacter takaii ABI70S6]|uniref:DNA-directed RNA polymerase subunit omega n=1 Tax=Thermosulfidibacter takaii (strain DSM 17441 / JCM 13301 / NBRC 103674 / ABI70S6) TaxID=1298851 RepID=A0A0S3QSA6_THET7|nr:DNA-directed RNA polymerase subunit omega [Thermosulfidibacter takaii]BAT71214.1 DNA-directed RNA polymerase subunit omega [Thermosulfidibacter takaii ABI70S6]